MADILSRLTFFDHFPSEFDNCFFKNLTETLFASDLIKLKDIYQLVHDNPQNNAILCILLASLMLDENITDAAWYLPKNFEYLITLSKDCSCLQQLLFEIALCLEERKCLQTDIKDALLSTGAICLLSERSNVVIRRQVAHFMVEVTKHNKENVAIRLTLFNGFISSDDITVIDEISYVLQQSGLYRDLTLQQIDNIYNKFLELSRPGLNVIKLITNILILNESSVVSKINAINDKLVAQQICSQLLRSCTLKLQPELLRLVIDACQVSVNCVIEFLEEIEEIYEEEMGKVLRTINANLSVARKCSNDSLIKYLNYSRLRFGISSSDFIQTLNSAKLRIQKCPEILDFILSDSEELSDLLREASARNIFNDLTVNILMVKEFPNWVLVDSAILILERIADFFDYDENVIHARIFELIKTREHEDTDYVKESAVKFLLKNCPDMVKDDMKSLFLNGSNLEIRIAVLERLILSADSELPSPLDMNEIFDDVLLFESNLQVKEKCLLLLERLKKSEGKWNKQAMELRESLRVGKEKLENRTDLNILCQMIDNAKASTDCFDDHVAKECY